MTFIILYWPQLWNALVVYNLPQNSGNFCQNVNGETVLAQPSGKFLKYSGTLLIRSPTSHKNLAVLTGWPHQRGSVNKKMTD